MEEGFNQMLHHSMPIRFSIGFLLLGCVTMISILWYNQLEQKENEERKSDAERLTKEAVSVLVAIYAGAVSLR